jgi:hypothetical protein
MRQRLRAFGVRGDHVRLGERVARGQSTPRYIERRSPLEADIAVVTP